MAIKFCPEHPETIYQASRHESKCVKCGGDLLMDGKHKIIIGQVACTSGDGSGIRVQRCLTEDECVVVQAQRRVGATPTPMNVLAETHMKLDGANPLALRADLVKMEERKDGAYEERNRVVAAFAKMAHSIGFEVIVKKTAIEDWSEDWHTCVYIQLPAGQCSFHFHDSQAWLLEGLPRGEVAYDGHTKEQVFERLHALKAEPSA